MAAVFAMLTRPSSDSRIDSRASSTSLSPALPSQPMSPLSPLSLASSTSVRSSSCSPPASASESPTSPSPTSPTSPSSPSINHLFPPLPPTFSLRYLNTHYTVHPLLLSHHSPFFHSLLTAPSPPTSFTLSPHPSLSPSHLLLLLHSLYTPPPPPPPPSTPSTPPPPFTPTERQLIAHIQPLLLLTHLLNLPIVLGWLDSLLQRCLEGQLKGVGGGGVGGGVGGVKGLGFVMGVWGMGLEYGLEGVARRAEEEMVGGGWGRWWEGEEWKAVEGEVREEVRERMIGRGREVEAADSSAAAAADRKRREQHRTW